MSDTREGFTDLGSDHAYMTCRWSPDRDLNPQYADMPDVDVASVLVWHLRPDGEGECTSAARVVLLPGEEGQPLWSLVSLDPLHLEPSLLCRRCGDHGFIRDGKWVSA